MNNARVAILLAGLTGLFLAIGYLLGGSGGMMIALGFALMTNLFSYWNADKIVLSMYGAVEVGPREAPQLYETVAWLAKNANMPMPKVYIIEDAQPNAFATGRDPEHAAVAATTGILSILSQEELAGVMAHELAHIKNRDTLTMTITATIAGAIGMLANLAIFAPRNNEEEGPGIIGGILMAVVAPLAASLVQMAISRTREYEADAEGAQICGRPLWLASALAKLEQGAAAIPNYKAESNPATAHMFIVNPLNAGGMDNLFSTHPNMENRIARLQAMAAPQRGPWG